MMKKYLLLSLLFVAMMGGWAQEAEEVKSCPGIPSVTDHEGNVYHTVQIGNQCWTRENMRATTSPTTGTYLVNTDTKIFSFSGKIARWYENDSASYASKFGLLYNWNAAMDTFNVKLGELSIEKSGTASVQLPKDVRRRGICPKGWHVPNDADWAELELTAGICTQEEVFNDAEAWRGRNSVVLAGGSDWSGSEDPGAPGNYSPDRNKTGFTALPGGYFRESNFGNVQYDAVFWTATQKDNDEAYYRYLYFNRHSLGRTEYGKYYGFSVRCIKD